jgi:diacylglycerol kinase family enzyme
VRRFRALTLDTGGEIDVMVDGESLQLHPQRIEVLPSAIDIAL